MPQFELLLSISKYGNIFSSQIEKNVSKEKLEPYFHNVMITLFLEWQKIVYQRLIKQQKFLFSFF